MPEDLSQMLLTEPAKLQEQAREREREREREKREIKKAIYIFEVVDYGPSGIIIFKQNYGCAPKLSFL